MGEHAKSNSNAASIRFAKTRVTVQNGAMVSSNERGLKVSRVKHNGVAFVNSSVQDPKDVKGSRREAQDKQEIFTIARTNNSVQQGYWREFTETRHYYGYWTTDSTHIDLPILKMLPVWASFDLSSSLPDSHKKVLCFALRDAPAEKYAFDDHGVLAWNPLRTKDTMQWLVSCGTRLQTVITLATTFKTFRLGQTSSVELATLVGRLYNRVHERLAEPQNDLAYHLDTLYSVVVLALEAAYRGQFFQWNIHMKALKYITKLCGGTVAMPDVARSAVHKADTAGALFSASRPLIPILPRHSPPLTIMPEVHCNAISETLQKCLSACGIHEETTNTTTEIAIFSQNWDEARKRRTVKFEPESMMEHFYTLKYKLLLHLDPLQNETSSSMSSSPDGHTQEVTTAGYSIEDSSTIYHEDLLTTALESSLRITLLIFLREQAIDPAPGTVAYSKLLNLLAQHLKFILLEIRHQNDFKRFIDPSLLTNTTSIENMRPVLIWICLVADVIQLASNVFGVDSVDPAYGGSIYKAVLSEILGKAADDTRLIGDKDWALCQILDMRILRGDKWDCHLALQRILGSHMEPVD